MQEYADRPAARFNSARAEVLFILAYKGKAPNNNKGRDNRRKYIY